MDPIDLLHKHQINEWEYKSYLLFEGSDLGRDYIKNVFSGVCMEEVPFELGAHAFGAQEGRRSIWRDTIKAIDKVKFLIEKGMENE